MKQLEYDPIPTYDRETALREIESGVKHRVVLALLALAHNDPEWRWTQSLCVKYSQHMDDNVRGVAILCFGHLARVHRRLDTEIAVPVIIQALNDPSAFVRQHADSALSDILIFCNAEGYDRGQALIRLESGRIDNVLLGLFGIAKHDDDSKFAEEICIKYSLESNAIIRGEALKGFATILFEGREIDLQRVMPILTEAAATEGYVGECARSTIDCIEAYLTAAQEL